MTRFDSSLRKRAMGMVLCGYWRSSAACRVSIGLRLKGDDYRQGAHDLRTCAPRELAYPALTSIGLVRILSVLRRELGTGEDGVHGRIARWIRGGFAALEEMASEHGLGFRFADRLTNAGRCLVRQLCKARRFAVDLDVFPTLLAIATNCAAVEASARAKPGLQPDANGPVA